MMEEHVHVWKIRGAGFRCKDFPKCPAKLSNEEVETRLNATERLSTWLRTVANIIDMRRLPEKAGVMMDEDLFTMIEKEAIQHADILEDK